MLKSIVASIALVLLISNFGSHLVEAKPTGQNTTGNSEGISSLLGAFGGNADKVKDLLREALNKFQENIQRFQGQLPTSVAGKDINVQKIFRPVWLFGSVTESPEEESTTTDPSESTDPTEATDSTTDVSDATDVTPVTEDPFDLGEDDDDEEEPDIDWESDEEDEEEEESANKDTSSEEDDNDDDVIDDGDDEDEDDSDAIDGGADKDDDEDDDEEWEWDYDGYDYDDYDDIFYPNDDEDDATTAPSVSATAAKTKE